MVLEPTEATAGALRGESPFTYFFIANVQTSCTRAEIEWNRAIFALFLVSILELVLDVFSAI